MIKLKSVCNQLLCYCQYITDREDVVLFLDPNNEQSKNLAINDRIRISGESRYINYFLYLYILLNRLDINLPELGSVALGITDIRKESINNNDDEDIPMEIIHTYDFNCPCNRCISNGSIDRGSGERKHIIKTI